MTSKIAMVFRALLYVADTLDRFRVSNIKKPLEKFSVKMELDDRFHFVKGFGIFATSNNVTVQTGLNCYVTTAATE